MAVGLLLGCASLFAQSFERMSQYEQNLYGKRVYVNAEYEVQRQIVSFWSQEMLKFKNPAYEMALTGNDMVWKITVPARLLYQANDTTLSTQSEGILRPLLRYVRGEGAYATLVVANYSDNNGSEKFLLNSTAARSRAIMRWFIKQGMLPADVEAFGLGNKVPRAENKNMRGRERNRRVTFYLVPNKRMLRDARAGKLSLQENGVNNSATNKKSNSKINSLKNIWQKN